VIGAEDTSASVQWVLVQTPYDGPTHRTTAVSDQDVVEHQAGKGVKGMTPGGSGGWHFEGEAILREQPPGGLIAASAQIQVSAQYHGVVGDRSDEVASLKLPTGGAKPLRPGWPPRVKVSADQSERMATKGQPTRDRNPALENERQLEGVRIVQREAGEDGVAPVAGQSTIPHGRGVAQAQAEMVGGLDHIFLRAGLGHQYSARLTRRNRWYRCVAAVGFLKEHDEREVWIRSLILVITIPNAGDDLAQPAPPDPHIPAEDKQTRLVTLSAA
jgi:hypothetical protein